MKHVIVLNDTVYELPELNVGAVCRLTALGVDIFNIESRVSALRTAIGFIALAAGIDLQQAGLLLEKHLRDGGDLKALLDQLSDYINDSPIVKNASNRSKGAFWPIAKRHGRGKKHR